MIEQSLRKNISLSILDYKKDIVQENI